MLECSKKYAKKMAHTQERRGNLMVEKRWREKREKNKVEAKSLPKTDNPSYGHMVLSDLQETKAR